MPRRKFYILGPNWQVIPATSKEWEAWYGTANRVVATTTIGSYTVTTIFVGVGSTLFETVVHDSTDFEYSDIVSPTHAKAMEFHRAAVIEIREKLR